MDEDKHIPPVGSIIFMKADENPAATYPGTAWEQVENNIYFVTQEKQEKVADGWKCPFEKPTSWVRVK